MKKPRKLERRERIEEAVIRKWKLQLVHGDLERMAKKFKVDDTTIGNATKGLATPNIADKVEKWLNKNRPIAKLENNAA